MASDRHGGKSGGNSEVQPDGSTIVRFGSRRDFDVPDLVELQTRSYAAFLQEEVPPEHRTDSGLEGILREVFPIPSYDATMELEYLGYELGAPRYTPDECRELRITFGRPFKIRVRLKKETPVEEEVYLGEIPIMVGGGEFIVNGTERVIVTQLHRSPGVDFSMDIHSSSKKLHSCWVIPERGSWIELNVTNKEVLAVRIDQSGKFPATSLLRAMSEEFGKDEEIVRTFYSTAKVAANHRNFKKLVTGKHTVSEIRLDGDDKPIVEALEPVSAEAADRIVKSSLESKSSVVSIEVIEDMDDPLVLNTLLEDTTESHEEALLKIYGRLRPGNPPQIDKAKDLFKEKFFDPSRYRLGKVGRFRLNRKFGTEFGEDDQVLRKEDLVNAMRYLVGLRAGKGEIDDIDHLGNRRIRPISELAGDEFRKGFLKLRRTAQERMNIEERGNVTPRTVINSKTISSSIEYFFGRGELSQVVDQTNPLSQLTHERRLSALGPGGLNRKRAGFEVRDVHISHYGRICPIETPEGTNIGLISSLGIFSGVDEYGFLTAPYRVVKHGKVTGEIVRLRADQERDAVLAPADTDVEEGGKLAGELVLARRNDDFLLVKPPEVQYMDVSPMQLVGVSAALIPFLEHDDANRALMGSNMQRQAVPLVETETPLVGTGMERPVAMNSGMLVKSRSGGKVLAVDATSISIEGDGVYELRKFTGLNERTCLNQRPLVSVGEKVVAGQVIADGAATNHGELALGKNVLVAFMPWDGYNFEDAILVSEDLVRRDTYTSVHIDVYEIEIRETKLGREEFTNDIPNVSERALRNLDETGVVRVGTRVYAGDILVGKVAPKSKSELSPEEKLLHAIFGRAGEDVKNDSLEVPPGSEGIIITTKKFSRKVNLDEEERQANNKSIRDAEKDFETTYRVELDALVAAVNDGSGTKLIDPQTRKSFTTNGIETAHALKELRDRVTAAIRGAGLRKEDGLHAMLRLHGTRIDEAESKKNKLVNRLSRGDELPTGVLELVKIYVATRRNLSVGDKMAGRHGNKGVISRILAIEDMPFLEDGTPVEIVLNPLGVPSRMNVGQILETHLGYAAKKLGVRVITPVFDGAREDDINAMLGKAGISLDGKSKLYDGRTGQAFEQPVTVGYLYMLKLHHLVDEKIHARATGPYSLITQQPLGGKARFGGQRFGEMEVWALEAYGAASVLQEQLTVKSDDVDGRMKIYEAMVKGENILEAGTPVSFDVLCNEIRGLAINIELEKAQL